MAMNPYDRGSDRHRRGEGQGHREHNPFEMMNTHMTQMQNMMDSAFGGDPFGGHSGRGGGRSGRGGGDPFGGHGGMGMMMDQMMGGGMMGGSMMNMGGGGGGAQWSSSSCCYSSSSSGGGGQPHVVQYSSSSHGMQRPGEEMVQESHRNYRDSSGQEQLGVSRRVGDRGRAVVAERRADGTEQRTVIRPEGLVRPLTATGPSQIS